MASFAYDNLMNQLVRAGVNFATASFKVMLVTSAYTPNQGTDIYRSSVTNEVAGAGYTAGGQAIVPTITLDTTGHRVQLTFPQVTWPTSTITARRAVYYLSTGSAATDLLIGQDDFGADVTTTAGTFTLNATTLNLGTPV